MEAVLIQRTKTEHSDVNVSSTLLLRLLIFSTRWIRARPANCERSLTFFVSSAAPRGSHKSKFPKLRREKCSVARRPILISSAHLLGVHHGSCKYELPVVALRAEGGSAHVRERRTKTTSHTSQTYPPVFVRLKCVAAPVRPLQKLGIRLKTP